jgi:hypothetical protein
MSTISSSNGSAPAHRYSDGRRTPIAALQKWWMDRKYGPRYRPPSRWNYIDI